MHTFLDRLGALPGSGLALLDEAGAHPLATVRAASRRVAAAVTRCTPAGARVGVLAEPGLAWVAALCGTLQSGRVAVPMSPRHPPRELAWQLRDAGGGVVLASDALRGEAPPGCRVLSASALAAGEGTPPVPTEPRPDEPAMLLYTSGTTREPKGVVIRHGALAAQLDSLRDAWALGPGDRLLHALPLHHMHGVAIALLPVLAAGGATHLLPAPLPGRIWDALGEATVWMAVPTLYHRLLEAYDAAPPEVQARWRRAAGGLRLCTSGSAPLPATLARRWQTLAGSVPLERYGMTETGVIATNPLDPSARRVGTVGAPVAGLELRLLSDDGEHGDGPGEVQVRGPAVFDAYWQRPAETEAAFSADEAGGPPWFRTGDVGVREPGGGLRLLGRASIDVIKTSGFKVSALEVEEALREHTAVVDAAVVGLPDEARGQRVVAAIVVREGAVVPDEEELRDWLRRQLAGYKVPRTVTRVAELPRNALGKVDKPALAAMLGRG